MTFMMQTIKDSFGQTGFCDYTTCLSSQPERSQKKPNASKLDDQGRHHLMELLKSRQATNSITWNDLKESLSSLDHQSTDSIISHTRELSRKVVIPDLQKLELIARRMDIKFYVEPKAAYVCFDIFRIQIRLSKMGKCEKLIVMWRETGKIVDEVAVASIDEVEDQLESFYKLLHGPQWMRLPNSERESCWESLSALERDLSRLDKLTNHMSPFDSLLRTPLGHVTPRKAGAPMKFTYFAPARHLKEFSLHEIDSKNLGASVSLGLESQENEYYLQVHPLMSISKSATGLQLPSFAPHSKANSKLVPACFCLNLNKPIAISTELATIISNQTGFSLVDSKKVSPLVSLLMDTSSEDHQHTVQLSNLSFNVDFEGPSGVMVDCIQFTHPTLIGCILSILRQQLILNHILLSLVCTNRLNCSVHKAPRFGLPVKLHASSYHHIKLCIEDVLEDRLLSGSIELRDPHAPSYHHDTNASIQESVFNRCWSVLVLARSFAKSDCAKLILDEKTPAEEVKVATPSSVQPLVETPSDLPVKKVFTKLQLVAHKIPPPAMLSPLPNETSINNQSSSSLSSSCSSSPSLVLSPTVAQLSSHNASSTSSHSTPSFSPPVPLQPSVPTSQYVCTTSSKSISLKISTTNISTNSSLVPESSSITSPSYSLKSSLHSSKPGKEESSARNPIRMSGKVSRNPMLASLLDSNDVNDDNASSKLSKSATTNEVSCHEKLTLKMSLSSAEPPTHDRLTLKVNTRSLKCVVNPQPSVKKGSADKIKPSKTKSSKSDTDFKKVKSLKRSSHSYSEESLIRKKKKVAKNLEMSEKDLSVKKLTIDISRINQEANNSNDSKLAADSQSKMLEGSRRSNIDLIADKLKKTHQTTLPNLPENEKLKRSLSNSLSSTLDNERYKKNQVNNSVSTYTISDHDSGDGMLTRSEQDKEVKRAEKDRDKSSLSSGAIDKSPKTEIERMDAMRMDILRRGGMASGAPIIPGLPKFSGSIPRVTSRDKAKVLYKKEKKHSKDANANCQIPFSKDSISSSKMSREPSGSMKSICSKDGIPKVSIVKEKSSVVSKSLLSKDSSSHPGKVLYIKDASQIPKTFTSHKDGSLIAKNSKNLSKELSSSHNKTIQKDFSGLSPAKLPKLADKERKAERSAKQDQEKLREKDDDRQSRHFLDAVPKMDDQSGGSVEVNGVEGSPRVEEESSNVNSDNVSLKSQTNNDKNSMASSKHKLSSSEVNAPELAQKPPENGQTSLKKQISDSNASMTQQNSMKNFKYYSADDNISSPEDGLIIDVSPDSSPVVISPEKDIRNVSLRSEVNSVTCSSVKASSSSLTQSPHQFITTSPTEHLSNESENFNQINYNDVKSVEADEDDDLMNQAVTL